MARNEQGQALRTGGQSFVKAHLAGKKHVRLARGGVAEELAAGAANNRYALDGTTWIADHLRMRRGQTGPRKLRKHLQRHRLRQEAKPPGPRLSNTWAQ